MSQLQLLRSFIRDRLIEAAEEIFGAVERTVADYQEISSTQGLHSQIQWLNVVATPSSEMKSSVMEPQPHSVEERNPRLDLEDPELTSIKEEHQELCIGQGSTFCGLEEEHAKFSMLISSVESEDDHVQTSSNTTIFGDCLGTLEEQTQTHIDKRTLTCHIYGDHVGNNRNVNDESIPFEDEPYKCIECSKSFNTPALLQLHMGTHREKIDHCCIICTKSFNEKSLLKRHMRTHTGEKPFHCKICPFRCSQSGHLIIHMRSHTGERPYTCSDCGKGFIQSSNLRQHMKIHSEPQQHSVQKINPSLDLEDLEPPQIKEEHQELCSSQEKTSHGLKGQILCGESEDDHVQTPSNTTIFGHCQGTLEEPSQIQIDKRTLSCRIYGDHVGNVNDQSIPFEEEPLKCIECSKTFNNPGLLQLHMGTHREKIDHSCMVCAKRFSEKSLLKRHMRTHTGEKPFHCKICPFRCSQSGHLIIHMRSHTGERPYTCSDCGKGFIQSSSLRQHMKIHSVEQSSHLL